MDLVLSIRIIIHYYMLNHIISEYAIWHSIKTEKTGFFSVTAGKTGFFGFKTGFTVLETGYSYIYVHIYIFVHMYIETGFQNRKKTVSEEINRFSAVTDGFNGFYLYTKFSVSFSFFCVYIMYNYAYKKC